MTLTRGVVTATTVIALATAAAGCGGHSHSSAPKLSAPGRILAYDDASSQLLLERPDATARQFRTRSVSELPNTSADYAYLLTDSGAGLLQVTSNGVKKLRSPITAVSSQDFPPGLPFLDHSRYVLAPENGGKNGVVKALPVGGGKALVLGHGYDEAGDPSAKAAYVMMAAGPQVSDFAEQGALIQPEGRIDRDVAGKSPQTLVTATQLDRLMGVKSRVHLLMSATPSPDGSEVVVSASSIDGAGAHSALLVITPTGQVIADVVGPNLRGGYWSPDGSRLAYFDTITHHLVIWQPASKATMSIAIPAQPSPWYDCVWSPDGNWLVCAGGSGVVRGDPTGRIIVNLTTRQVESLKTSDEPVAWLPN